MLKGGIESSLHDVGLENDLHGTMNSCRDVHASGRAMLIVAPVVAIVVRSCVICGLVVGSC